MKRNDSSGLISMYLIVVERGIAQRHPVAAKIVRYLKRIACRRNVIRMRDGAEQSWQQLVEAIETLAVA